MKVNIKRLMTSDRSLLLAYDHGLEHGPTDFNADNVDPDYVLDIAVKGKYNGMILQKGVAEKYFENYTHKVPLIVKLNGKTRIANNPPYSPVTCSVKRAVELGAEAVGFTVYDGSPLEPKVFTDFRNVQEEAHDFGLPVVAWMYPRGKYVKDDTAIETLAYAARVGLELGADILKMKFNPDIEGYRWVIKSAGKVPIVCAGSSRMAESELLTHAVGMMQSGAKGMAIGRNVWQHDNPLGLTRALKKIIFENKGADAALKCLKK